MPQINKTKVKETKNSSTGNFIALEDLKYGDLVVESPLHSFKVRKPVDEKESAHGQVVSHSIDAGDRGDVNVFERWRSSADFGGSSSSDAVQTVNEQIPDGDGNVLIDDTHITPTYSTLSYPLSPPNNKLFHHLDGLDRWRTIIGGTAPNYNSSNYRLSRKSVNTLGTFANTLNLSSTNFITSGAATNVADVHHIDMQYGSFTIGRLNLGLGTPFDIFNLDQPYLNPVVTSLGSRVSVFSSHANIFNITQSGQNYERCHAFTLPNRSSFYSALGNSNPFSSFAIMADRNQISTSLTGSSKYNFNSTALKDASFNPINNIDVMFAVNSFGKCFIRTLETDIRGILFSPLNYSIPAGSTFLNDYLQGIDNALIRDKISNVDITWVFPQAVPSASTFVNATGGNITLTLPQASLSAGLKYNVKKVDASANTVTIDPFGAETIDGAATHVLSAQYQSVRVVCNGAQWFIV